MWVPYAALSNTYRALSSVGLDVKYVPQSREPIECTVLVAVPVWDDIPGVRVPSSTVLPH